MSAISPPQYTFDKRWNERKMRWVAPGEVIDTRQYGVEPLAGDRHARAFVIQHHYAQSFPASRLNVGLYRHRGVHGNELVGVATFSVPMQPAAVPRYTGFESALGVELGRFVLLPCVPFNGETWFLRRALKILRAEKPEVRSVISYADPMEWFDRAGRRIKPAHAGQIYQASNAMFGGRAASRYLWMSTSGQVISGRMLSKIARGESGRDGGIARLLSLGAPARQMLEEPKAWLCRVLPLIARRVRHPGNFVYAFSLDRRAHRQVLAANEGGLLPYPKIRA